MTDRVALYQPASRAEWRKWLRANHAKSSGIWLVFLKGKDRQLSYNDAVEEALCFGWIDSLMKSIDERSYRQLFTPRKPKSHWSALNKQRVASLMERGLMAAPGLAIIEEAKKNGAWTAIDHVEALTMPADLKRAFASNRKAKAFFDSCAPSRRKGMLHWINNVKSAKLRAERVAHVVSQCAKGLSPAHQEAWMAKTRAAAKARRKTRA